MVSIIIKNQAEGVHFYPDAPDDVAFLRLPHRHIFHVQTQIEVGHNDRELEFIVVKHAIQTILDYIVKRDTRAIEEILSKTAEHRIQKGTYSCEDIAESICNFICRQYVSSDLDRRIEVEVWEDNENGAKVSMVAGAVKRDATDSAGRFDFVCEASHVTVEECIEPSLQAYIQDVIDVDREFDLTALHACTSENLSYMTLCLAGEVGELANEVKKLQRDGETGDRWQKFEEEMVDILIYFCELLHMTKIDFNQAWAEKHVALRERFKKYHVNGTRIGNRHYRLRG